MADNFRILKTGSELASDHGSGKNEPNNDSASGINWLIVVFSILGMASIGVWSYHLGKNSVMPELIAAKAESERLIQTKEKGTAIQGIPTVSEVSPQPIKIA